MSDIILKTEDLGISFGGLKAVQGLNLEIKKKQLYGLVGPNGAGKTTVFNMLTGVYLPTTGKFYLDGEDLTGKNQIAPVTRQVRMVIARGGRVIAGIGKGNGETAALRVITAGQHNIITQARPAEGRKCVRVKGVAHHQLRTVATLLPG